MKKASVFLFASGVCTLLASAAGMPYASSTAVESTMDPVTTFLIDLVLTILIYTVPILIYRYAIVRAPLPKKKAKLITFLYAFIMFFASVFVSVWLAGSTVSVGGGVIVWSWVNYRILIGGYESIRYDKNAPIKPAEQNRCRECGAALQDGATYCPRCGTYF